MSKIDELIQELCPDGVEYKSLENLGNLYGGITGKSKDDFKDGNARFITYMNVFSNIAVDVTRDDYVKIGENEKQRTLEKGDILFTGSSENPDECGMSSVITEEPTEPLYLNSFCFFFRLNKTEIFLPGFLKYLFRDSAIRKQINQTASGVTRFNISKKRFMKIRIPIPPLEVQKEIVNILDKFTQLEAELEAELEARRKQYEFYRKTLLQESSEHPVTRTVKLGDVCKFQNGFAFKSSLFRKEGTPILRIANIQGDSLDDTRLVYCEEDDYRENLQPYTVKKGDVVVAMSGATTGKIGVNNSDTTYYLNQRVGKFVPDENLLTSQYLYFILLSRSREIYEMAGGGAQPNLSTESIKKMMIPIPPLNVQKRIVDILQKYDKLTNDIHAGLPAEINARRQQYEYYRTKLLTFQEQPV